jgi:hypothetical protein
MPATGGVAAGIQRSAAARRGASLKSQFVSGSSRDPASAGTGRAIVPAQNTGPRPSAKTVRGPNLERRSTCVYGMLMAGAMVPRSIQRSRVFATR